MTEAKVYCDHCGKVLNMKDYCGITLELLNHAYDCDLCVECFDTLCGMLEYYVTVTKKKKEIK